MMSENLQPSGSADQKAKMLARRRQLITSLAASPVALTLASRSAWANGCTISGTVSGNLSHKSGTACAGLTPGYWKNHLGWPGSYGNSYKFNNIPGFTGFLIDTAHNQQTYANQVTLVQCFEPAVQSVSVTIGSTTKTVTPGPSNGQGQEFLQEVVCAILTAAYFTNGAYGYTQPEIISYIALHWNDPDLYNNLKILNQDARAGYV